MKKYLSLIALTLICFQLSAQGPFYGAIQKMVHHSLPRGIGAGIAEKYKWGPAYWIEQKDYPLAIYKDIRLDETYFANQSPWPGTRVICCIPIPGCNNTLLYCGSRDSECAGNSLIIADKDGYVLDSLIVSYHSEYCLFLQWFIYSDWTIKVTSLAATEADSFNIWEFTWFRGQRTDRTYVIRDGKFVLTSTQKYQPKRYTKELLARDDYDLMKGGETPMN